MNIARNLERSRDANGDRIAIRFEGTSLTYRRLDELASRAALRFAALGVRRGDSRRALPPEHPD